MLTQVKFLYF